MKIKFIMRLLSVIGILFATPIVAEDNKIPTQEEIKVLQLSAEKGNAKAQYNLASAYENGTGVQQSYPTAIKWYIKSAELGYDEAMFRLGYLYDNGIGVKKDNKIAIKWYTKAAELGLVGAQQNLGLLYSSEKNYQMAIKWHKKAAKQGLSYAQYSLALIYFDDEYEKKDNILAYAWIILAAKNGDEDAKLNLKVLKATMTPEEIAKAKQINPLEQE